MDYDIGEKGTFWNGRIVATSRPSTSNWGDCADLIPSGQRLSVVENQGKVKSRGWSWRTAPKVNRFVTLNLNASFTDAEANGPLLNLNATFGRQGAVLPRWIVTTGPELCRALGEGSMRFSADYTFRSAPYNRV